jgi:hypothetical protein
MPIRVMTATLPITAPAVRPADGPEDPPGLGGGVEVGLGDDCADDDDALGLATPTIDRAEDGSEDAAGAFPSEGADVDTAGCLVNTAGWLDTVATAGMPVTTPSEFVCWR